MADLLDDIGGQPTTPPVTFRRFDDIGTQRQQIYDRALVGARDAFKNIESDTHRLELVDAYYSKDANYTIADEKKALLTGGRLQRPLKGRMRLVDKVSGQTLDEQETTLAHVPHLTKIGRAHV